MRSLYIKTSDIRNKQTEKAGVLPQKPSDFSNKTELEVIRGESEQEHIDVCKTSITEDRSKQAFSLNVQNKQKAKYSENEGRLSVTSEIKGHTKFENDTASIKTNPNLHATAEAEKHGSANVKSNIKLTALTNDIRSAPDYLLNSAKDEAFDYVNGGYVKKVLKPLDNSLAMQIDREIKSKLTDDTYSETEKTELSRLKDVNTNTLIKKGQLKIEVEAKAKQVVKTEHNVNSEYDFFYFLFKRKAEDTEDTEDTEEI